MTRRYIVTRTDNAIDVFDLALDLLNKKLILDWGFANPLRTENGIRWWMEVNE